MKKLWEVIVEKAKEVESTYLLLGLGVFGLFLLWGSVVVIVKLFKLILAVIELFGPASPVGG